MFSGDLVSKIESVRNESVITVSGEVVARTKDQVNPKIPTGEIEVKVSDLNVISHSDVLPFQIAEDDNAPEATRLQFRFLELRREDLHNSIKLRSGVIKEVRDVMHDLGFTELQTPILTSSSPEGARDFLVPSRHHPGKFFALPQAPQQFKQLYMVAGFDRYFQIAPCFRDEDPRADRSPGEFYQCDLEMSFVEQEDIFTVCEELFYRVFSKFSAWPVSKPPFVRIPYDQALSAYGSDKPDLRIPFVMNEVTDIFSKTEFRVFKQVLESKGCISTLPINLDELPPRKFFDDTVAWYQALTGSGLAYVVISDGELKGTIAKFVTADEAALLKEKFHSKKHTILFFAAGQKEAIFPPLGKLRVKLGNELKLIDEKKYEFCWIIDYPMYERDAETGEIGFSHNPFSMPQGGLEALNNKDPLEIKAFQYDVVCNGYELSSGAVRNHLPEIMYRAFEIAGYSKDVVDSKFGGMIKAFKFGAPPHGGMAPGIDRIVMLLAQKEAIRDVIAYPLAQSVEDLMMNAPSDVSEKQLKELHLKLVPVVKVGV